MAAASERTDWRWEWKLSDIDTPTGEDERRWATGVALSMTIRVPGSTRGSRVGDGVLAIANFPPRSFTTEITEITEPDFLSVLRVLRG